MGKMKKALIRKIIILDKYIEKNYTFILLMVFVIMVHSQFMDLVKLNSGQNNIIINQSELIEINTKTIILLQESIKTLQELEIQQELEIKRLKVK